MEQVKSISDVVSKSDDDQESTPRGPDFGFAFNNTSFSDRVLMIQIITDLVESKLDDQDCSSTTDCARNHNRNRKRRREDFTKENDDVACKTLDGEAVAVIEESQLMDGNEVDNSLPSSPGVKRVMTLHITSAILAAQSPFFYKLFSNGMRESEQRQVTLRVHASEEAALMDLLTFIYSGTLQANTPAGLLDVLMAADKFEVASCMRYCSNMLGKFTMTLESALLYLDLSSGVLMAEAVKPLIDEAKKFLGLKFKDISKYQEEVMNLPLAALEAILSSDRLQVASEDAIFDLSVKWVLTQKVVTQVVAGQPKVTDDYVARYKGNYTFMGGKVRGCRNLFGLQWNSFIADDSPFFVNGVLHIRAELTIRP